MRRGKRLLAMVLAVLAVCQTAGCSTAASKSTGTAPKETTGSRKEASGAAAEPMDLYVFIAASLKNTMETVKESYEKQHPGVTIIYNADSSGTLKTQIEEGARCDVFFSAATRQMDELKERGYVVDGSVHDLLMNQVVLIKPKGGKTKVTGFDNITQAANLALAGEDVPVGQYARKMFTNMGLLDSVMKMEINEGPNVTAVLTAVAEGSNEVGIVYATDAASMADSVEIIAKADKSLVDPAIYPVGLIKDKEASEEEKKAAEDFVKYLTEDQDVRQVFTNAGFELYSQ
ncbi:molybdate ABC transporter substrate-binding protein [Lacrimispora sp. JR3]|uniref:molybdate ABC transporter substrate-binding protein n=1 Tax=Lacrimispora sinapis TaxID=3111456 RepID=UPI00374A7B63